MVEIVRSVRQNSPAHTQYSNHSSIGGSTKNGARPVENSGLFSLGSADFLRLILHNVHDLSLDGSPHVHRLGSFISLACPTNPNPSDDAQEIGKKARH